MDSCITYRVLKVLLLYRYRQKGEIRVMKAFLLRFARVLVATGVGYAAKEASGSDYAMFITPALAAFDKLLRDKGVY